MKPLLALSRGIDTINRTLGRTLLCLTLIMTLISAVNALVRKLFDMSSNAFLESSGISLPQSFSWGWGTVFSRMPTYASTWSPTICRIKPAT